MKRVFSIALLLGLSSLAAFAQSNDRPSETKQQQTNADGARLKAQRRYDPPGGQKQIIRGGPLEALLDSINQRDIDYGRKLADARQIFLGGTVENLYFWIIVAEGVTVLILVLYVFWLFRREGTGWKSPSISSPSSPIRICTRGHEPSTLSVGTTN